MGQQRMLVVTEEVGSGSIPQEKMSLNHTTHTTQMLPWSTHTHSVRCTCIYCAHSKHNYMYI